MSRCRLGGARRLMVPADAVLDSGTAKTIFMDRGNGYFEPRQVETGERIDDRVEIVKGLRAGERVVTSGTFLMDSESQLKAAATGGAAAMIHRIIDFSGRNKFVVFLLVGVAVACGLVVAAEHAARRHSRPLRHAGHRLLALGPQPGHHGGPGHLSHHHRAAGRAARKDVRGFSDFGYSYVYIIFDEGTDIYWARSRTLEYLSEMLPRLPPGVQTELGRTPPASAGSFNTRWWTPRASTSLARLRSYQDWYPALLPESPFPAWRKWRPSAAWCASTRSTSIPTSCRHTKFPIRKWWRRCAPAITTWAGAWWNSPAANTWCAGAAMRARSTTSAASWWRQSPSGVPIRVKDIGQVTLGPDIRRGVADLDGKGDAVGGIVDHALRRKRAARDRPRESQTGSRSSPRCRPA